MADTGTKVRENRLRRWAARLGMTLHRSRARNVHLDDFGEYQLREAKGSSVVAGARHELGLADVEEELRRREADLSAARARHA
jgi:hypothetical protein